MAGIDDVARVYFAETTAPFATPTWVEISNISAAEKLKRGVRNVSITTARRDGPVGIHQARSCTIEVNNLDGDWDKANSANSVFGSNLDKNRLIQVRISDDNFTGSANLFTGYIDDIIPAGGNLHGTATIVCQDMFRLLEQYPCDLQGRPTEYVGDRVTAILDHVGIPAGLRNNISNGQELMAAGDIKGSAMAALRECNRAEMGVMYIDRDGDFNFYSRYAVFDQTPWSTQQHSFVSSRTAPHSAILTESVVRNNHLQEPTFVRASRAGGREWEWSNVPTNFPPVSPSGGPENLQVQFDAQAEPRAQAVGKSLTYDNGRVEQVKVQVWPDHTASVTAIEAGHYEPLTYVEVQTKPSGFSTDWNYKARIEGHTINIDPQAIFATVWFSPRDTALQTDEANWASFGDTALDGKYGAY